jgi:leucine dehydrogenase
VSVFRHPEFDGHQDVLFVRDREAALSAIIAIHDAGPTGMAGGGVRMWNYRSDDDALADVLRLSRAMTYKLALAGVPAGGAKSVILGDPATEKTEALLEAFGRAVERLGGRYVAAEDVGTNSTDMEVIARGTQYVMTQAQDTSRATGRGVFVGMQEAVARRLGRDGVRGLRVAVQGVGAVGRQLCRELAEAGASLTVADLDRAAAERIAGDLGAAIVDPGEILDLDADVFAPCALGSILDPAAIARLRCKVIAGSANEQLADPKCAELLAERGILYAPDFVINAGGVLGAGFGVEEADRVGPMLAAVFDRADRDRLTTHEAALRLAKEKLAEREA